MSDFHDPTVEKRLEDGKAVYYHRLHDPPARMTEAEPYAMPKPKGKDRKQYGDGPIQSIHYFCPECPLTFYRIERVSPRGADR